MQEKKIKYLTISVFALIAVNVVLVVFMFMHRPPLEGRQHRKLKNRGAQFIVKKLDLTAEQEVDFRTSFEKHKIKKDQIEDEIRKQKRTLFRSAISGDTARAQAIILELNEANENHEWEMYAHLQELKKICTPQQIEKLSEVVKRRRDY